MKSRKDILERIVQDTQKIEIPDSLQPESMRKQIEAYTQGREKEAKLTQKEEKKRKSTICYQKAVLATACLFLFLGIIWLGEWEKGRSKNRGAESAASLNAEESAAVWDESLEADVELPEGLAFGEASYEDIYAAMLPQWESQYLDFSVSVQYAGSEKQIAKQEGIEESAIEDLSGESAYGTTNIQTVGVDEGDTIKNDGRYLYQIINIEAAEGRQQAIQIVDTKEGLSQIGCLEGFQNIREFYVRENRLIVIENKDRPYVAYDDMAKGRAMYDIAYMENTYHEISFYDLENRNKPSLLKKFTLEGSYTSSRIFDGYFYGFSRYYAVPGEGKEDYRSYIPQVDGQCLSAEDILLPKESEGTSYLVLVSVDLEQPTKFVQTKAVVSTGDMYYVSGDSIYVTSFKGEAEQEGWSSTTTDILKFSYREGKFMLRARGEIKGQLESSFSLDEYNGHLRAVTTVREYHMRKLVDDRTGKSIGYEVLEDRETNSLYVLDENLEIIGSIEGLAEDERIYSARFLGETGYFVTFRQTDPLYAVDLSNPQKPEILSELKISGFSEYLHLYGTDRLLGIGMEADEETGIEEGMKLSMFDLSDPANIQEVSKLLLAQYDYSEALYNHKAVLINSEANILGFEAEGYEGSYQKKYLVFSYDRQKDAFVQEMVLDAVDAEGDFCQTRGTFIGDTFYLLCRDGSITSYDRTTGRKLNSMQPTKQQTE